VPKSAPAKSNPYTLTTIHTDGTIIHLYLDRAPTLQQYQDEVGGYIQEVPHLTTFRGKRCVAYCNEEGLILNLKFNPTASDLWLRTMQGKTKGVLTPSHFYLHGPVVIHTKGHNFAESVPTPRSVNS